MELLAAPTLMKGMLIAGGGLFTDVSSCAASASPQRVPDRDKAKAFEKDVESAE